jgi:Tfp pilus assembly protein PilN
MAGPFTLEQIETLVAQLPPRDQLRLVAHIGEQLSVSLAPTQRTPEEVDALMAELDAIAESIPGEFDAVQDIQANRDAQTDSWLQVPPHRSKESAMPQKGFA